jgi:hypothetical protein
MDDRPGPLRDQVCAAFLACDAFVLNTVRDAMPCAPRSSAPSYAPKSAPSNAAHVGEGWKIGSQYLDVASWGRHAMDR